MEALLQATGVQDVPRPAACFAALPGCQCLTGVQVGGQIEVEQPHCQQSPGSCAVEEWTPWGRGEPGGRPCTAEVFGAPLGAACMHRSCLFKITSCTGISSGN